MTLYACQRCGTVRADDTECRVCGFDGVKAATDPDLLDPEPDEEAEEEEYECPDCGDTFDTPQGLASHSRTHNGE